MKHKSSHNLESCSILPDGTFLVACWKTFSFYSESFELLKKVSLNSFTAGLLHVMYFKPLLLKKDTEFVMVADIDNEKKIEARNIKHVHEGKDWLPSNLLMLEVIVKDGQLHWNIVDKSLFLKYTNWAGEVTELADGLYMLGKLIIENLTVIREVDTDIDINKPMKVTPFHMENLPFVIAMKETEHGHFEFYLINIKTGTA